VHAPVALKASLKGSIDVRTQCEHATGVNIWRGGIARHMYAPEEDSERGTLLAQLGSDNRIPSDHETFGERGRVR
jgi:hypothetical protein